MTFPQRADLYRISDGTLPFEPKAIRTGLPCRIVPASQIDRFEGYAYQATHVVFLPRRMATVVRKDDELHTGRRVDNTGKPVPFVYVIRGIRVYRAGLRHVELFCEENQ